MFFCGRVSMNRIEKLVAQMTSEKLGSYHDSAGQQ